jgi:hypothetical protein
VLCITAMVAATHPATGTLPQINSAGAATSSARPMHPLLERAVGRFLEWVVSSVEDRRARRLRGRR